MLPPKISAPSSASVVQPEARVIRLPARLDVEPEALPEPGREDRALETVLERQTHAEVGRQAEGASHFRGPYVFRH